MRCPEPTTRPAVRPIRCPPLRVTACADCDLDVRPPEPCGAATASGGQGVTRTRHALGSESGIVRILFQMFGAPDRLDCFHAGVLVATTGDVVSGTGELSFRYDAGPRVPESCLIVVTGPVAGTQWIYTLLCPA